MPFRTAAIGQIWRRCFIERCTLLWWLCDEAVQGSAGNGDQVGVLRLRRGVWLRPGRPVPVLGSCWAAVKSAVPVLPSTLCARGFVAHRASHLPGATGVAGNVCPSKTRSARRYRVHCGLVTPLPVAKKFLITMSPENTPVDAFSSDRTRPHIDEVTVQRLPIYTTILLPMIYGLLTHLVDSSGSRLTYYNRDTGVVKVMLRGETSHAVHRDPRTGPRLSFTTRSSPPLIPCLCLAMVCKDGKVNVHKCSRIPRTGP